MQSKSQLSYLFSKFLLFLSLSLPPSFLRLTWYKARSQVDMDEGVGPEGTFLSTTHRVHREPNPELLRGHKVIRRGSVPKVTSQIVFGVDSVKFQSSGQLKDPQVVYAKEVLPLVSASKVALAPNPPITRTQEPVDYLSSTGRAFAKTDNYRYVPKARNQWCAFKHSPFLSPRPTSFFQLLHVKYMCSMESHSLDEHLTLQKVHRYRGRSNLPICGPRPFPNQEYEPDKAHRRDGAEDLSISWASRTRERHSCAHETHSSFPIREFLSKSLKSFAFSRSLHNTTPQPEHTFRSTAPLAATSHSSPEAACPPALDQTPLSHAQETFKGHDAARSSPPRTLRGSQSRTTSAVDACIRVPPLGSAAQLKLEGESTTHRLHDKKTGRRASHSNAVWQSTVTFTAHDPMQAAREKLKKMDSASTALLVEKPLKAASQHRGPRPF